MVATALPPALVYGLAIGLSAFLLFTVQPMVGRLVTPVFGGAPAVWTTALAFYQVVLLAGYAYAHVVATRLSPRTGVIVHAILVGAVLVFALARPAGPQFAAGSGAAVTGLLATLTVLIGPQAFLLCATTPLLSTWYARVRRAADPAADPRDPYWLYALSNGGSLIALLAYPFLIEPRLGLSAQVGLWTTCLFVLGVVVTAAGLVHLAHLRPWAADASTGRDEPMAPAPTQAIRLTWVALAAIPTALLAAVTNQVTTDLISAPLLWVVPLAIYLGSFIVAFSSRGVTVVRAAIVVSPAALTLLWVPTGSAGVWPIIPLLAIEYAALGVVAVALHGRLAASRPVDSHLTEFYLLLSSGGAIGGVFVAVVAPIAFKGVWELPIVIVAALAALAATAPRHRAERPIRAMLRGWRGRLAPYLAVAVPLLLLMAADGGNGLEAAMRWVLVGGLVLVLGGVGRFLTLTTAAVLALATFVLAPSAIFRDRSFFGVVEVLEGTNEVVLMHGTTVHGRMARDPALRSDPGSYYARSGPVGDLFAAWSARPPGTVRIVGLGAGSIAAYARPQDAMVFFEIDPLIARVAEDPSLFTYLSSAHPTPTVAIGDGRLLISAEPADSIDMLVMDAFSSDAVPSHLITREAFADADRALRPNGVIAVHISNRYYDLGPPVAAALTELGYTVRERQYVPSESEAHSGASISHWLVATRDERMVADLQSRGWVPGRIGSIALTDDFPDLMRFFGR